MTQEELARVIAAEVGADAAQLEAELSREKTRSFGQQIIDAATVGAFVAQATQLAIQLYAPNKTAQELIAELQGRTASAIRIADEKRRAVIEHLVRYLTATK